MHSLPCTQIVVRFALCCSLPAVLPCSTGAYHRAPQQSCRPATATVRYQPTISSAAIQNFRLSWVKKKQKERHLIAEAGLLEMQSPSPPGMGGGVGGSGCSGHRGTGPSFSRHGRLVIAWMIGRMCSRLLVVLLCLLLILVFFLYPLLSETVAMGNGNKLTQIAAACTATNLVFMSEA